MATVTCSVQEDDNIEYGESVIVTCGRCSHSTTSFGTSERSIKRCLAMLREECPSGENNFYVEE